VAGARGAKPVGAVRKPRQARGHQVRLTTPDLVEALRIASAILMLCWSASLSLCFAREKRMAGACGRRAGQTGLRRGDRGRARGRERGDLAPTRAQHPAVFISTTGEAMLSISFVPAGFGGVRPSVNDRYAVTR
jgi:hypothetical protein